MSDETRTVQLSPLSLRADVVPRTVNEDDRSVEVIFTTGAAVRRTDFWTGKSYLEVLSLDPAHVRMERFNQGAPLLDSHSAYSVADMLGVIVPGSVELKKTAAVGRVRFSKRAAVEPVWQDVRDGLIRSVSIGYRVYKFEEKPGKTEEAPPVRTAVDWEPFEASMVPIPADAGARVRSGETSDANPCEIVRAATQEPQRTHEPAPPAEETKTMSETRSQTIVEANPLAPAPKATPPAPPEPNERDLGAEQERQRCLGIRAACKGGRMTQAFEEKLIRDGVSLERAQSMVFEEMAKRDVAVPAPACHGTDVRVVGEDPFVHVRAGIANALLHRIAPERHPLEDVGRQYRGMSILDIGKAFVGATGRRVTNLSRSELVDLMLSRSGLHSTSDFAALLEDVAHKNLRSAYEAAPQTWQPLAKPISLTDFKPSRQLQIGDAPGLDEVLEHGEFTSGSITEAKETITLKTYGKIFGITRQALINDDLNAFGEVPSAFGRKARDKESDLAWAEITANGNMGDGVALFEATTHKNYTSSGTAISVDSLGVGRKLIRQQKGLDGVTPLNLSPTYLIVPAAKETIADQYVSQILPSAGSSVNPFMVGGRTPLTVIVEPRLDANSATAWYLACSMAQAPVLYHGTLDGQGGPDLRQEEGFSIDGLKFRARLDVAFKAADWRAIYKNAGA